MKTCAGCGETKPYEEFYRLREGRNPRCIVCISAYNKVARRRLVEKDPDLHRRSHVRTKYGLTLEEYEAIVAHPCEICGTTDNKRVLDHDHDTGRVRGSLCDSCNQGIGRLREDEEIMHAAMAYLSRS